MLPSRSLRVGIIVLGLTGISSSLAFSACADFDGEESPDASPSSSSSSGGSGSSTSSASSSSSSGTVPDVAAPEAASPDAGSTSSSGTTPGPATLRCGSFYCDTSKNEVCCNAYDAGGACIPFDACFGVEGRFRCDNNRDCDGGVCCLRAPGTSAYSECAMGNCGQVNVPLCEVKDQCPLPQDECIDPVPLLPNGYRICKAP